MTELSIDDALTVSYATATWRRIIDAISKNDGLEINLGALSDIDIAGFQLLVATVKECDERSIACAFTGKVPPAALKRAEDAGFKGVSDMNGLDPLTLIRAFI